MAKNATYKSIVAEVQQQEQMIRASDIARARVNLEKTCKCVHKDPNGGVALKIAKGNAQKSPYTGANMYECRLCHKLIDVSQVSQDEFNRAIATIDRVIDIAKMRLDLNSREKDDDMRKKLTKLQFRLMRMMPDTHKAISKTNKKQRGNSQDSWMHVNRS